MVFKTPMFLAACLMDLAQGVFFLVGSLAAAMATERAFLIGAIGTAHYGVKIIFSVFFGRLSDRVGRRGLLLLACALKIVALLLLLGPTRLEFVSLSYLVAGITAAIFWPLISAWVGDGAHGDELLQRLGRFNIAFSIGMLVGPLVTGWALAWSMVGAVLFGVFIIGLIMALILKVAEPPVQEVVETNDDLEVISPWVYVGWLANVANFIAVGLLRMLFPKIGLAHGFSSSTIGVLLAIFYGGWFVVFLFLLRFSGWPYRPGPLLVLQSIGIFGFLILWRAQSALSFAIGLFLFGLCVGMTYFSSLFYCQDGEDEKGHKAGYHETFLGVGMLIGPVLGGLLADRFSLQTPFLFCAIVVFLAMGVQVYLLRRPTPTLPATREIS
ncbi:MAG: MFS transporter [Limnochordia bacterium]|jgi:MFS family permease